MRESRSIFYLIRRMDKKRERKWGNGEKNPIVGAGLQATNFFGLLLFYSLREKRKKKREKREKKREKERGEMKEFFFLYNS